MTTTRKPERTVRVDTSLFVRVHGCEPSGRGPDGRGYWTFRFGNGGGYGTPGEYAAALEEAKRYAACGVNPSYLVTVVPQAPGYHI